VANIVLRYETHTISILHHLQIIHPVILGEPKYFGIISYRHMNDLKAQTKRTTISTFYNTAEGECDISHTAFV
jgi:hypothetical protein